WITNSDFADVFVVYAKINGEDFSAFIVEREFPGVSVGPEEKKMGIKSSSTRTLVLEDAEVPVENLLGEQGRGHIIAFNILNRSEEHTSELQSRFDLVCRLLLEKKKNV